MFLHPVFPIFISHSETKVEKTILRVCCSMTLAVELDVPFDCNRNLNFSGLFQGPFHTCRYLLHVFITLTCTVILSQNVHCSFLSSSISIQRYIYVIRSNFGVFHIFLYCDWNLVCGSQRQNQREPVASVHVSFMPQSM